MRWLWWLGWATLIPGMFARVAVGGAGILAFDVIGIAFACLWWGKTLFERRYVPKLDVLLPLGVFVLVATLSWVWNAWELGLTERLLSASYIVRLVVGGTFAAAAFTDWGTGVAKQQFEDRFFLLVAVVLGLAFAQFYVFPDISTISTEGGWDPHQGRLLGTWLDPNFLGGFLALMIPIMLGRADMSTGKRRWLLYALVGAALYGVFLTFSRSGYLAMAIALVWYYVWKNPRVLLVGALVFALGVATSERAQARLTSFAGTVKALVLRDTDEIDPTANLRLRSWGRSLELWQQQPLLGIGYNTYRTKASEFGIVQEGHFNAGGADSTHLTVLVTTGVLGGMVFLWWAWVMWWGAFSRFLRRQDWAALGMSAGWAGMFVHAVFVNTLFFPFLFFSAMAWRGSLMRDDA